MDYDPFYSRISIVPEVVPSRKETPWFQMARGRGVSEKYQALLAQFKKNVAPLMGRISVLSGRPEGSVDDLDAYVAAVSKNGSLYCTYCRADVIKSQHSKSCDLVKQYTEMMEPLLEQERSERAFRQSERERLEKRLAELDG